MKTLLSHISPIVISGFMLSGLCASAQVTRADYLRADTVMKCVSRVYSSAIRPIWVDSTHYFYYKNHGQMEVRNTTHCQSLPFDIGFLCIGTVGIRERIKNYVCLIDDFIHQRPDTIGVA